MDLENHAQHKKKHGPLVTWILVQKLSNWHFQRDTSSYKPRKRHCQIVKYFMHTTTKHSFGWQTLT